jgi:hypothetical protein
VLDVNTINHCIGSPGNAIHDRHFALRTAMTDHGMTSDTAQRKTPADTGVYM